jgi:hypothetical protein
MIKITKDGIGRTRSMCEGTKKEKQNLIGKPNRKSSRETMTLLWIMEKQNVRAWKGCKGPLMETSGWALVSRWAP